jgi:hypothetical protein
MPARRRVCGAAVAEGQGKNSCAGRSRDERRGHPGLDAGLDAEMNAGLKPGRLQSNNCGWVSEKRSTSNDTSAAVGSSGDAANPIRPRP